MDLVDYRATSSHLFALWTTPNGDPVLRFSTFNCSTTDSTTGWSGVVLEAPLDPEFLPGGGGGDGQGPREEVDPRQAYLQQLFHPGRFSMHTLARAVCVSFSMLIKADIDSSSNFCSEQFL
jgi:hypothetical protein